MAKTRAEQIQALISIIKSSPDVPLEGKKALIWLLIQTDDLKKSLILAFNDNRQPGMGYDACLGVQDMHSVRGSTDLDKQLREQGIHVLLQDSSGYVSKGHEVWVKATEGPPPGYDYDLSHPYEVISPDMAAIQKIELGL